MSDLASSTCVAARNSEKAAAAFLTDESCRQFNEDPFTTPVPASVQPSNQAAWYRFTPERIMTLGNQVPDKTLQKNVDRKLMQKCPGSARISATVRGGDATVTGTLKNEYERKPIVRCVAAVQGIRRVVDQLQVLEKKKPNG